MSETASNIVCVFGGGNKGCKCNASRTKYKGKKVDTNSNSNSYWCFSCGKFTNSKNLKTSNNITTSSCEVCERTRDVYNPIASN